MPRDYIPLADRLTAFLQTELGVNDSVVKSLKPRGFALKSDGAYLGINAAIARSSLCVRFKREDILETIPGKFVVCEVLPAAGPAVSGRSGVRGD